VAQVRRYCRSPGSSGAVLEYPRGTALSRKTFWALLRHYGALAGLSLPPRHHTATGMFRTMAMKSVSKSRVNPEPSRAQGTGT